MIKSTNRQVFSENLRMAILADEIASSLRYISRRKQLAKRDERIIDKAMELLGEMRRGMEVAKSKRLEGSLEASLAYGQAIQAIQLMPRTLAPTGSFGDLVDSFSGQLKSLRAAGSFDVRDVCEFFTAVREVAMAGSGPQPESVKVRGVDQESCG
jgi:hypothetical protein